VTAVCTTMNKSPQKTHKAADPQHVDVAALVDEDFSFVFNPGDPHGDIAVGAAAVAVRLDG
jgi:hypothetical protein